MMKPKMLVEGHTLWELSKETGILYATLRTRYRKNNNITLEEIKKPVEKGGSHNQKIFINGEPLSAIAKRNGVSYSSAYHRMILQGRPEAELKTKNPKEPIKINGLTFMDMSELFDIPISTIRGRYYKHGEKSLNKLVKKRKKTKKEGVTK